MQFNFKKIGFSVAALGLTLAISAKADVITYTPAVGDLYDLDHNYAYTWRINSSALTPTALAGKTITSVNITITNIRDWTIESDDVLYIRMLNDAASGTNGIAQYYDDQAFGDYNAQFGGIDIHDYHDLLPYTQAQLDAHASTTLSYDFTQSQIATLMTYAGDGHFAMAFDPDCHYFNDGIKLTVTTMPTPPSVPEPGSLLLVGAGLVGLYSMRGLRRRFAKAK